MPFLSPLSPSSQIELGKGDEEDGDVNCDGVEWGVTGVAVTTYTAWAEDSLKVRRPPDGWSLAACCGTSLYWWPDLRGVEIGLD